MAHVRYMLLPIWLKIFLFLCGWCQVRHSQHHGPTEVVTPLKITNARRGMRPPSWTSYRLQFGGQRHIVHMKVNKHLLARHMPVFTYTDQGVLLEDQPFVQSDCFYYGYVEGDPESLIALSSCFGGFRGILKTDGTVYEIEPKSFSTTFEHLVHRMDSETSPSMRCGLTDEEIARQLKFLERNSPPLMQSEYLNWWTHKRYLELAVVVDNNRYLHHKSNTTMVQNEVCLVVNIIADVLKSLDIDVVVMGVEIWTKTNPIAVDIIDILLPAFCLWKKSSFNNRLSHDIAHIFVKKDFSGTTGLAYIGSVCEHDYNCGVISFTFGSLYDFANTGSHEIGHNLGMIHDEDECVCGEHFCIMYAARVNAFKFSNCSYNMYMNTVVKKSCLTVSPRVESIFKHRRCGNRITEEDEECDCGSLQLCEKDPCCQSNCTLTPGSVCASGLCCKDCKLLPSGTECRKQENECDLPEWCNGTSFHCPDDMYVQDGTPCVDGGYCYEKRCNDRDEQCRKIFGKDTKSANDRCYREVNTQGDRFGHCGYKDSQYIPCNMQDILCGRVQCENVTKIPLLSSHTTVHWTYINGTTCWGTDYHFGMTIPDIGEVKDGTQCGVEKVCIKRKCVSISLMKSPCSPKSCNMKGVCNNRHHCHCNAGWSPPNCLLPGNGGSIDISSPYEKMFKEDTKNWLLIWLIFLSSILLSVFILFGMRMNKASKK
ncbi:disintegrin and metalloproteinase domain-containing protein 25-like [Erinaceus europaeus]|uniref:Disintegrin and metalloproteinase domain-containing protein 25-like n=1 Tax=Erinaceus europaeus TaxID=9365 RepID=A0A1S3WVY7_ERIEU|nr:disintegrin and metalloproteinase domain-containing protein 25-like [Erinaceus europaeus]